MTDNHHHLRHPYHLPTKKYLFSISAAFLAVFSLGYILGSFSSSTLTTPPPAVPPRRPLVQQNQQFEAPETSALDSDFFRFFTKCSPPLNYTSIVPKILRHVYNGVSPYADFPPPHLSPLLLRDRRFLHGWGSTGAVFQTLISKVNPSVIIEVGTFLGASALHMANLTRGGGALILCLDDFRGWPGFRDAENENRGLFKTLPDVNGDVVLMQQFMQNVVDAGEEGRVVPVPFSTAGGLAALCEWGVYGDLVEVDAGHDFHSAWADINMAWAVVRKGGVMFGHDYNLWVDDMGVRRAVDLFAKVKGLTVEPMGEHWVLWPPKSN